MSNIRTQKWLLNRRHFLPRRRFDNCLALAELHGAAAGDGELTAVEQPRRSVFVYVPNGVNVLTWQIAQPGPD